MGISTETKYGKITVSDKIIEDYIAECCQRPQLYDKLWLAPKSNISAGYNEEGLIDLKFSVYAKFGQSIKGCCQILADMLADIIKKRSGNPPGKITVNVAGVRSNNLAKRNMDLEFEYGQHS